MIRRWTTVQATRPLSLLILVGLVLALAPLPQARAADQEVTNTNDSGTGSLRQAITDVSPGGTITFNLSSYPDTIYLSSQLLIDKNLTITGPGADQLTISGNKASRVFYLNFDKSLTLEGLTVADGSAPAGTDGGAIYNDAGTVTVKECTFSGNSARGGGAIHNQPGALTVTDSTFSGNSATNGGAIYNLEGWVRITSSTFSGNRATNGGGIRNYGDNTGSVSVINSTFSGNSATGSGGAIHNQTSSLYISHSTVAGNSAGSGGGICNDSMWMHADLQATIVANSLSGNDCAGPHADQPVDDKGDNLDSDGTCKVGTTADPLLGPLQNNGGPTETHALLPGSPAIDTATCQDLSGNPLTVDQRGVTRPQDGDGDHVPACDMGAFELAPGTIIIEKETVPGGGSGFVFSQDIDSTGIFPLDDTGSKTFDDIAPGQYAVTEVDPTVAPGSYDLTALVCQDSDPQGVASTGDLNTRTATINLDSGETVTCTFTNTGQPGKITVEKQTLPAGTEQAFTFTGAINAQLKDDESASEEVVLGTYQVTETEPDGWSLDLIICSDADSTGDPSTRTATFRAGPGEHVTCVFVNSRDDVPEPPGTIVVAKETTPDADPARFTFEGDAAGMISDGQRIVAAGLQAGTYTSRELVPPGWDLTGIQCDDTDSSGDPDTATATFRLQPGETVTCTFTNTRPGTIVVEKQTYPGGDSGPFAFQGALTGSLGDGDQLKTKVQPGTYTVREVVPGGWELTSVKCDDSNSRGDRAQKKAVFKVAPGEKVTCTFTNSQQGSVTIIKDALPQSSQSFDIVGDLGSFALADDGQSYNARTVKDLEPGRYTVREMIPSGWYLAGIKCVDQDGGTAVDVDNAEATIDLDEGEAVVCTFENRKTGTIVVAKETVPPGSPALFAFEGDAAGEISDGQSIVVDGLQAGTYTSRELVPEGWTLTSIQCDDGESSGEVATATATFRLQPGETVVCRFTDLRLNQAYLPLGLHNGR
jgi:predicted outer membrane repeat protein